MMLNRAIFSIIRRAAKLLLRHRIDRCHLLKVFWYKILRPLFLNLYPEFVLGVLGLDEELETELFKREIKRGDIVLDIGANAGYYSLIAAKSVGENGKVFAFEPAPANFALLQENIKAFGYRNVVCVEKAVASETGKARLYLSENSKSDHRIYDPEGGRKFINVEVVRLDDYFRGFGRRIDVVKMDIQGAEMAAIEGMDFLLKKNKDLKLYTEFWPAGLKRFGVQPEAFLSALVDQGFKLYDINERKKKIEQVSMGMLLKRYTCKRENYTNLFCLRGI